MNEHSEDKEKTKNKRNKKIRRYELIFVPANLFQQPLIETLKGDIYISSKYTWQSGTR